MGHRQYVTSTDRETWALECSCGHGLTGTYEEVNTAASVHREEMERELILADPEAYLEGTIRLTL